METIKESIFKITLNKDNPRLIRDNKFDKLVDSIIVFPRMLELRPIVVDGENVVLGGNMRLRALRDIARMTAADIAARATKMDGFNAKDERERAAILSFWDTWLSDKTAQVVRASSLTEDEKREFIIKDNVGYGEWDFDILSNGWDMEKLSEWGLDLDFGKEDSEDEEKEAEEDGYDVDAENIPERCEAGDIWELGSHRLLCGDSTKPEDIERLMGGERADLVITDPPYNVDYTGKSRLLQKTKKILNDNMSEGAFSEFLSDAFRVMNGAMKPGAAFYVWFASMRSREVYGSLETAGLSPRQELVWVKNNFVLGRQDYQWMHEPCVYGWKDGRAHYFTDNRSLTTVFEDKGADYKKMKKEELLELVKTLTSPKVPTTVIHEDRPMASTLHPTMKPVKLIGRLMANSSRASGIVLDPFGGSGSALVAAEQLARKCFTMEITTHYCDVIIDRWEKLTGKEAKRISCK